MLDGATRLVWRFLFIDLNDGRSLGKEEEEFFFWVV